MSSVRLGLVSLTSVSSQSSRDVSYIVLILVICNVVFCQRCLPPIFHCRIKHEMARHIDCKQWILKVVCMKQGYGTDLAFIWKSKENYSKHPSRTACSRSIWNSQVRIRHCSIRLASIITVEIFPEETGSMFLRNAGNSSTRQYDAITQNLTI